MALAPPDWAEVEVALAAEPEAEVEEAGLVAELLGGAATLATAPLADTAELEDVDDVDVEVDVGKRVLHETPPVPVARTTEGRATAPEAVELDEPEAVELDEPLTPDEVEFRAVVVVFVDPSPSPPSAGSSSSRPQRSKTAVRPVLMLETEHETPMQLPTA